MKIEMSTDGSKQQKETMEDSASDDFSLVSDSEHKELNETAEHEMVIQELKKEIFSKDIKISSLEIQLADAEKSLKQKETIINEKDDLIKIELISQIKYLQLENTSLKNTLDLTKNLYIDKEKDTQNVFSNNQLQDLQEFNELKNKMVDQESTIQEMNNKIVELIDDKLVNLKDELKTTMQFMNNKILKLEDKSKTNNEMMNTQNNNVTILLNHSKIPHIKFLKRDGISPFTAVFEDIPFVGSGWMVIQRRFDGKVNFTVTNENSYVDGFGDLNGDFWIGVKAIHQLTSSHRHELFVQLVDFDDVTAYARYDNFCVGNKESRYELKSLGNYSGNAGDALRAHEKNLFIKWECPEHSSFFWWKADRIQCVLNGPFSTTKQVLYDDAKRGIWWGSWYLGNKRFTLKSCKMLIRPKLWNE
ncbi:fibroleukin-like [Drosophila subpulchrella]|uniref:fibroleukin-like n=1 Tax=Drosophila subpulchrella TaxID=1486046 RepID=UPI0018A13D85|nr:fibroleukin-like [Drosophila subpulchrella]